jgi:hypothetical protein
VGSWEIDVEVTSKASPETVWRFLSEVETWPTWSAFDEAALEAPGSPDPQGVGALRRFRFGRVRSRERVVAFEPPRRFAYDLVSGLPVRDYHAEVTLTARDGGTAVRWHSTFRAKYPGTGRLVQRRLSVFVRDVATRLAAHAASAG